MLIDGHLHDHSFWRDGGDTRTTSVTVSRAGPHTSISVESGLKDLLVLKTTGSAFYGFVRDKCA
jgi:urate oxidase